MDFLQKCCLMIMAAFCFAEQIEAFSITKVSDEKNKNRSSFTSSMSTFSGKLLLDVCTIHNDSNVVLSPLSISSVLGMLWLGARGETRRQIEKVSGFGIDSISHFKILNEAVFRTPLGQIEKKGSHALLANGMFFERSFKVGENFLKLANNYFLAEVEKVDFSNGTATASRINEWVKHKTFGMIDEIVSDNFDPVTKAVITNAVYFSGKWRIPFKADESAVSTFSTLSGKQVKVPMLRRKSRFQFNRMCITTWEKNYPRSAMCTNTPQPNVLVIPYENQRYVMTIFVPNNDFSFSEIEEGLGKNHKKWRNTIYEDDIRVEFPKFQITFETDVLTVLRGLGITDAFDTLADFTNMSESKLYFSDFKHKSSIIVDEHGTTASAASAVVAVLKMSEQIFSVDRSFFFLIEDIENDVQLFAGKVIDPTTTGKAA